MRVDNQRKTESKAYVFAEIIERASFNEVCEGGNVKRVNVATACQSVAYDAEARGTRRVGAGDIAQAKIVARVGFVGTVRAHTVVVSVAREGVG